jgi:phosphonate transport system substrate-binding protein
VSGLSTYTVTMFLSQIKFLLFGVVVFSSCIKSAELGSVKNPLKFYLVPAQDILTLEESGKKLKKFLSDEMQMHVEVEIPTNYIAVVEAFGSKRADAAVLNTFGYILANERYGAVARLKLLNRGRDEYYGQIIVHKDGPKTLQELNNKKFAFVDPASTSGYLLPIRLFKQEKIKVKDFVFSGRHDTVVAAVYQRKVDGGATFYTPPDEDGTPKDARWILRTQYPDVYEKVRILKLTGPIPNDPLTLRKDLPEEVKNKLAKAMQKYITTDEGKKVLFDMYHITDFKEATDKDYDIVRSYLKDIGQTAEEFIKK